MKKLYLLLIVILLMVGCQKSELPNFSITREKTSASELESNSEPQNKELFDNGLSDVMTILYPLEFKSTYFYTKADFWSGYIEEKYNVEVVIDYFHGYDPENYAKWPASIDHPKDGILYLNTIFAKYINDVIHNYEVTDLTKFYDAYNWYQYIDQAYIDKVTYHNKILAVPVVSNLKIIPRFYNQTFLQNTNKNVPESIDELTEFLVSSKKFCDTNAPLVIATEATSLQSADIFRAFGVYLNTTINSAITINPQTSSFEDGVYNENFYDALSYFKMLKETRCLDIKYTRELPVKNIATATEYNVLYEEGNINQIAWTDGKVPEYESEKGYYLKGINEENCIEIRKDIEFYIFNPEISNLTHTVEIFNEVMFTPNYYYDLKYGIENVEYRIAGEKFIQIPGNSYAFLNIHQVISSSYSSSYDLEIKKLMEESPKDLFYESNTFSDLDVLINDDPTNLLSNLRQSVSSFQSRTFDKSSSMGSIFELLRADVSIDDIIYEYKKGFSMYGVKEELEMLNSNLGVETVFDYNN